MTILKPISVNYAKGHLFMLPGKCRVQDNGQKYEIKRSPEKFLNIHSELICRSIFQLGERHRKQASWDFFVQHEQSIPFRVPLEFDGESVV